MELNEAQTKAEQYHKKVGDLLTVLSNINWEDRLGEKHRGIKGVKIPNYVSDAWAIIGSFHSRYNARKKMGLRSARANNELKDAIHNIQLWMRATNATDKNNNTFLLIKSLQDKDVVAKLAELNREMYVLDTNPMKESAELKSFKAFLSEGFTHSTHLEDLVIDMGVDGTRSAINALRDFRDSFSSKDGAKQINLSTKWDGAPAVIFGTHPETKKFFVGTKGVFAKNPKINYTHDDVNANHSGGLADKLHEALDYLPKVTPKGRIFQGDFMFSKSDLGSATINGEASYTMHPNTIVYTVPKNSDIGKAVGSAKMGIVVHTEYHGSETATMKPTFGISVSDFKPSKDVWLQGAVYQSEKGFGNLTSSETAEFDKILSTAGSLFKSVSSSTFKLLSTDADINSLVNIFANSKIRAGAPTDPATHAHELKDWIEARYQKEIDSKSTEKSKDALRAKLKTVHDKIDIGELTNLFKLQSTIAAGKQLVINKLNEINNIGTFVKTASGEFKVTNHEGFVGIAGDMAGVKLVDRLEFSHNNFSKNIIKGWDSATRG